MIIGAQQRNRENGVASAELAVMLALVCILAAFAIPRFVTLEEETRSAATESLGGALRSQAAHAHELWLQQGQPDAIRLSGRTIAMHEGYPAVSSMGALLPDTDGYILDDETAALVISRSYDGVSPVVDCSIRYWPAERVTSGPQVQIETRGC